MRWAFLYSVICLGFLANSAYARGATDFSSSAKITVLNNLAEECAIVERHICSLQALTIILSQPTLVEYLSRAKPKQICSIVRNLGHATTGGVEHARSSSKPFFVENYVSLIEVVNSFRLFREAQLCVLRSEKTVGAYLFLDQAKQCDIENKVACASDAIAKLDKMENPDWNWVADLLKTDRINIAQGYSDLSQKYGR